MEFFNLVGKLALGSRLRLLTERITTDAAAVYRLYGIDMEPKWFPVFYVLSAGELKTITQVAKEISHSHPSVSKIIREMTIKGLIKEKRDKADGRRNMVSLSAKGMAITKKIPDQYTDVNAAIEAIAKAARNDLWKAMEEWEFLLDEKSLLLRVEAQKKIREGSAVKLVDYQPKFARAFKQLNEEWISTWFTMETADYKALDNPQAIIDNGGYIQVALYDNIPVGVCALLAMKDPEYDYELVKMAVSPAMRGKNIGWLLGTAIIEKARALGARQIYLESNTILKPAINLYQKLGFKKVVGHATPYARCNIQMGLVL